MRARSHLRLCDRTGTICREDGSGYGSFECDPKQGMVCDPTAAAGDTPAGCPIGSECPSGVVADCPGGLDLKHITMPGPF